MHMPTCHFSSMLFYVQVLQMYIGYFTSSDPAIPLVQPRRESIPLKSN